KEELVGLEREAVAAAVIWPPDRAHDGRDDRPDDQPADQEHRRGNEQEAVRPPAGFGADLRLRTGRVGGSGHASRSTFGATLRYQPSLMAVWQSPPGKLGIDCGTMSAKRSRRSAETWSQETPGKPPSSVRMALWISSVSMKSPTFRAASLLVPLL